jgi:hypothetical protein
VSNIADVRGPMDRDVQRVLDQVAEAKPDEVLIVYIKGGDIHTVSTGTFSRARTVGLLEQLKFDILKD